MKHLCLLIQDDPDWYDPRTSLKGFNPAVTKDTIVLKSPHTHPAISNIEVVRKFGATHNRGEPGTLAIISHGAFEKTGLLSSRPVGGAIGFGGGKFLTRGTAGKLLGWTPYHNDILLVGCAVAATTAALPEDPVAFDGNGAAFCRAIANLLSVTVHASTTPMTMNMWKTPGRGDSVMEWANFLARAGNYVAFKAAEWERAKPWEMAFRGVVAVERVARGNRTYHEYSPAPGLARSSICGLQRPCPRFRLRGFDVASAS